MSIRPSALPAPPRVVTVESTAPLDHVLPPASLIMVSPGLRLIITAGKLPPSSLYCIYFSSLFFDLFGFTFAYCALRSTLNSLAISSRLLPL